MGTSINKTASLGAQPIRFDDLIAGWGAEKRPADKTAYEWKRVLRQFATFLGHDDARRITADDVVAWKGALVEAGLHPKTIRDAKLAPARAVLQWAVDNRRLASNAAERVGIDIKVKPSESRRGFSDEEAVLVLRAAQREKDPVRRWVPWLCSCSGARVSEVCQLRAEDVLRLAPDIVDAITGAWKKDGRRQIR